jgi:hypothetical protein
VSRSLLEAIKQGDFNFEPSTTNNTAGEMPATAALPGTTEKLDVLAERMRLGLPLWHPSDRRSYDDKSND